MYVQLEQSIYILFPAKYLYSWSKVCIFLEQSIYIHFPAKYIYPFPAMEYMSNGKYIHTSSLPRTRTQYPRQVGGHRILAIHHAPPPPHTTSCSTSSPHSILPIHSCSGNSKMQLWNQVQKAKQGLAMQVKIVIFALKMLYFDDLQQESNSF